MIKQKFYLTFIFTIILTLAFAQKSVNQYNKDGKRHGLWTKTYYKTDQKRYEGTFVNGKEVDTFKYYALSKGKSVLSAIKIFNPTDSISDVIFYSSKKKIISKGRMNGKRYMGKWVYFHKDGVSLMIEEYFNDNGLLDGERKVFYQSGNLAESAQYMNGKLEGTSKWILENGQVFRSSVYSKDQLNGKTVNYDSSQNITSEGKYTNNRKVGIWKYYEGGKIKKEIDHTNQVVIKTYE